MHHGSRLKKIVEKSGIKIEKLLTESGVTRGSLYNFFGYEDIPRKKIKPLLEVLKVNIEDFYTEKQNVLDDDEPLYTIKEKLNDALKRIALLEQTVKDKDEIIDLLKSKHKK